MPAAGSPADAPLHTTDVALLIDWENLKWGLHAAYRTTANVSSLLEAAGAEGRIVTARAYGDWTQRALAPDATNLFRNGIDPVFTPSRYDDGRLLKNSADVRLAVDAVDLCRQLAHVRTYVLVTGDGDLVHAVNYLRLAGRRVVVIATREALSRTMAAAADAVVFYEQLEPGLEPVIAVVLGGSAAAAQREPDGPDGTDRLAALAAERGAGPHGRDGPQHEAQLDQLGTLVVPIVRAAAPRSMTLAELGTQLRAAHGVDARAQYGVGLKQILVRVAPREALALWTEGSVDYVGVTGPDAPADAPLSNGASTDVAFATGAARAAESGGDITLESLTDDERPAFVRYLAARGVRLEYFTYNVMLKWILRDGALPRLDRGQVMRLLNDLTVRGVFRAETAQRGDPASGRGHSFKKLFLNAEHPLFADVGSASGVSGTPAAGGLEVDWREPPRGVATDGRAGGSAPTTDAGE